MDKFFSMSTQNLSITLVFSLISVGILAYLVFKIIKMLKETIDKKDFHFPNKMDITSKPKEASTPLPMEDVQVTTLSNGVENNIVSLVLRVQALYSQYSNTEKSKHDILLGEQLDKLRAELKNFTNEIKTEYDTLIKSNLAEDSADYITQSYIFDAWIREQMKDIQEQLTMVIKRNHLRQKQTEDFEDTVRSIIDTTYADIKSSILRAPEFIKYKSELTRIFNKRGDSYRQHIEIVLQYAKRESIKTANELETLKASLNEEIISTVERFFPEVDKVSMKEALS